MVPERDAMLPPLPGRPPRRGIGRLLERSPAAVVGIGLALVVLLGTFDYLTGYELSFAPMYLAPVALVAWYAGRTAGAITAVVCAATWHTANTLAGEVYPVGWIPVWNAITRLAMFLVVTLLLARLHGLLRREQTLSRTDALTSVANGRAFHDAAAAELARARRSGKPLTMVLLDLDDFKSVNDRFGHIAGDRLLRATAAAIQQRVRGSDVLGRLGGDEFAILAPETDGEATLALLRRVRGVLDTETALTSGPIRVSIGAATFERLPESIDEMIRRADDLMYRAKREGKNRFVHAVFADEGADAVLWPHPPRPSPAGVPASLEPREPG